MCVKGMDRELLLCAERRTRYGPAYRPLCLSKNLLHRPPPYLPLLRMPCVPLAPAVMTTPAKGAGVGS